METIIKLLDENDLDLKILEQAGKIINNKGLVVFPTETVYGLGANALEEEAVKKIFIAKGRPQDNPLIVHISDFDMLNICAKDINEVAFKIMEKFFPGPITLILNKSDKIPKVTSANLDTIGVRMPSNKIARALIKKAGVPIAAPSANISGRPSPTDVERCIEDLDTRVDLIIGGGMCEVGLESTIVDLTVTPPCILRPGKITLEMLKEIEPNIYIDKGLIIDSSEKPKAPGMKYKHYAPKAEVKIVQGDMKKTIAKINEMVQNYKGNKISVGIMATEETKDFYKDGIVISMGTRNDLSSIGKNLFETLRSFDDKKVDVIISESFYEEDFGLAIMNRLKKSAGFNIIKV
ncbi:MAG: L-threonylcarbamoyladenylate synthase [Clostridiaceae bacterium]